MKNRRNIIESELPPQNHLDIWMKDGKFYRSTNKGWVLIEDQMEFTNSELMSKSTATSGTIGVNKETGEASIYNDVAKQWSPLGGGGGGMTEITYSELKNKRDAGKLIPGSLYRITDYNCTTAQVNTQSAGHQFDIVLLALSADKLAEEGWAMMHDADVYDVTFEDGVTKKCYLWFNGSDVEADFFNVVDISTHLGIDDASSGIEIIIDESNKTATCIYPSTNLVVENLTYNYFQNSNLSAWKVWYCLDNDTARFAWADDSIDNDTAESINVQSTLSGSSKTLLYFRAASEDTEDNDITYYGWLISQEDSDEYSLIFTLKEVPENGDTIYLWIERDQRMDDISTYYSIISYTPAHEGTGLPNGRGVIYRLIDEWGNDCPYDFKNILYVEGEQIFVYTFSAVSGSPTDNPIFDASIKLAPQIKYNSIISRYYTEGNTLPHVQFVFTTSNGTARFNSIIASSNITIVCPLADGNVLRNCIGGTYQMENMYGLTFWNCENNYSTTESPFYIFDAPAQINSD